MATMVLAEGDMARADERRRDGFLIGPIADSVLLIGSPLLALAITGIVFVAAGGSRAIALQAPLAMMFAAAVGILSAAHVVVTLVRTHGNAAIFRRHRIRFTVVPVLLFAALALSPAARSIGIVVLVVWDVHHSGMQTFGLARLYARKAGNVTGEGRRLDLLLNHVLYAGPILAGGGLLLHVQHMGPLARDWDLMNLSLDGGRMAAARVVLVVGGLAVIAAHAIGTWRLHRRGHPVSPQAVVLLASTGVTSIVSWGLNPFGLALVTMKISHAVQYFALMSKTERAQVAGWFGAGGRTSLVTVGLTLLLPALLFGAWAQSSARDASLGLGSSTAAALILTLTLLHFWYDGFTWGAAPMEQRGCPSHSRSLACSWSP